MDFPEEELFAPGHRGCAGCGASIAARLALKAAGKNTVVISATGCLEVMTTPYPESAWGVPFIHVAFANSGAVASGVAGALKAQGKEDVNILAFGGDGGTVDIGLQSLSGAMERGHDMTYICYDNEAYMNTGIQRSGATPFGASTTTSPAGIESFGKEENKKNMPLIMAAHGIPYVATACVSYPEDYMKKVKRAMEIKGPAYIHILQPCTTGWGYDPSKTIDVGRKAVESGACALYEIDHGEFRITYRPQKRIPVKEYLSLQKRFRHLKEEQINQIQEYVDANCEELGI